MILSLQPPCLDHRLQSRGRRAFSLLEVLLALAVFGVGFAGLVRCLHISEQAGTRAQFTSAALLRCRTIHGLLESGALQAAGKRPVPFRDDDDWTWICVERPTQAPSLVERIVTVEYARDRSRELRRAPRAFSLSRLVAKAERGDPPTGPGSLTANARSIPR